MRTTTSFTCSDYLALGVGVAAGYLVLAASSNEAWRKHRFETLRWAVAIALMWSSLREKFRLPRMVLVPGEERPFLTFGLPPGRVHPHGGHRQFTMGFGLLGTPRWCAGLSALALS